MKRNQPGCQSQVLVTADSTRETGLFLSSTAHIFRFDVYNNHVFGAEKRVLMRRGL